MNRSEGTRVLAVRTNRPANSRDHKMRSPAVIAKLVATLIAVTVIAPHTTAAQTIDPNTATSTSAPNTTATSTSTTSTTEFPTSLTTTTTPGTTSNLNVIPLDPPPPSTEPAPTNPPTTITDTQPPTTATTTTDPDASVDSTSAPPTATGPVPIDINVDDDASPEPVPNPGFKPTLPATIIAPIRNTTLERMLLALSAKQRAQVVTAQSAVDRAQNLVAETSNELDDLSLRLKELAATRAGLEQQTEISRRALRSRGIRIYTGSNLGELDALLLAEDPSALARQIELLQQSQQREAAQLKRYAAQQSATEQAAEAAATLTASKQRELRRNLENQRALNDALTALQLAFAATNEGLALAINGWVFPVQPPFSFVDTFGAPRMFGTKYAHSHEGTDIFATEGTPLRAVARGVIARKGQAVLGGNKLWLVAADGTQYYYAHMSAFVEGVDEGTVVEAGQVIGFVGTTGNARGTPSHVHFEIHPLGGQAINPAPTLEAVRRSNANSPALPTNWNQPLTSPDSSTATTYRAGIGVTREYAIGAVDATAAGSRSTLPPGVSIPAPVRSIPG